MHRPIKPILLSKSFDNRLKAQIEEIRTKRLSKKLLFIKSFYKFYNVLKIS